MSYTLAQYFRDAGVNCDVSFAEGIEIHFQGQPGEPDIHQKTGLNRALTNVKFGLYDECDMGKSCVMQAYAMFYASQGVKVVGVMLPVLLRQFEESIFNTFRGADKHFKIHRFDQPPKRRAELVKQWQENGDTPDIILVSYQMFVKEYRNLMDLGYGAYFADEADGMCNPETLANKAMGVATEGEGVPLLNVTGTPNRKELSDCYGLIKLTNPDAYQSFGGFKRQHVDEYKDPHTKQVTILGYHNEELLHRNLYAKARRATKESIGRNQKPRVTLVPVELTPEHYRLYRKVLKERILEVDGELIDGVSAQALRQIATRIVTTPDRYIDSDKKIKNNVLEAIGALLTTSDVENHEQGKIILFAHYNTTIQTLAEHFKHLNPALMYGVNTPVQNKKNQDKFKEDPTCRILICNAICAGVGVDGFQHVCNKEIFVEPQATPRTFIQAVERVNRRGQKYTCHISILNILKTVYPARMATMLDRNTRIKNVNKDKYSFLDELCGKTS